jgi:hypothetical protein
MNTNLLKATVRSLTPWVISGVVYVITHLGYHVSLSVAAEIAALLGTVVTIGAHALEVKWPWFGVFLGWIGAPAYQPTVTKAQLQKQIDALTAELASATSTSTAL